MGLPARIFLFPHAARSGGSCISEFVYMRADEFLGVIKAEIVGKKCAAASVNRDQLVVAAADIHTAPDALLDLVPFSRKFAPFSSGIYVITLVDFNFYCFYRQVPLPPLSFYVNYTVSRRRLVNHAYNL